MGGFTAVFVDGRWLEVGRETKFEGTKVFHGAAKLRLSTLWVVPYLAGQGFAAQGQGELTTSMALIDPVWKEVIAPAGLSRSVLFLADALYGNDTALQGFEACPGARGGRATRSSMEKHRSRPSARLGRIGAVRARVSGR